MMYFVYDFALKLFISLSHSVRQILTAWDKVAFYEREREHH